MTDNRYAELFQLTSVVSLVFQILATTLIAMLSYAVARGGRRREMLYFSGGWACYAASLVCILLVAQIPIAAPFMLFGYYFFEYAAVLLFFAGCRYTATAKALPALARWALVPAAAAALALALAPAPFFWMFALHTTVVGLAWIACLIALWPAVRRPGAGAGVRIVAIGLGLLAIDYLHHLPTGLYMSAHHTTLSAYYYTIDSLIDGMLDFVLGFGTVVIILDIERGELAIANARLKAASDRNEQALHTDPLTAVLNRYSFEQTFRSGVDRRAGHRGCVVVADLDGLKEVNDRFGHAAGDAAIRAVAEGLRSLMRGGDRIYRWGGDEFVVVMSEMPEESARRRMETLDVAVNAALEPAFETIGRLHTSWGVYAYDAQSPLATAIDRADRAMYDLKARRKAVAEGLPDARR